jgi:hypothetical protein
MKKIIYVFVFYIAVSNEFAFCAKKSEDKNSLLANSQNTAQDRAIEVILSMLGDGSQEIQVKNVQIATINSKYCSIHAAVSFFYESLVALYMGALYDKGGNLLNTSIEQKIIEKAQKIDEKLDAALQHLPDECRVAIKNIDALVVVQDTCNQLKKIESDYVALAKSIRDNYNDSVDPHVVAIIAQLIQEGRDLSTPSVQEQIVNEARVKLLNSHVDIQAIAIEARAEVEEVISDMSHRLLINLTDSVRIINNERIREINNIYSHPRVSEVNRSRRMLPKNSEKLTTNLQEKLETLNVSDS